MGYRVSGADLSWYLGEKLNAARAELSKLDPDYLLRENAEVLLGALIHKYIPEPIRVAWDDVTRSGVEETMTLVRDAFFDDRVYEVPASKVRLTFPIFGESIMLDYRASTYTSGPMDGEIKGNVLLLDIVERQLSTEVITARVSGFRTHIDRRVEWANGDLRNFSSQTQQTLHQDYESRKQRLLNDRALEGELRIPVRSTGAARLPIPAQRKDVTLETRQAQATFVPEPVLEEATYRQVLEQVQAWARSLERTPGTLAKLAEEDLRDLLLAQLNGYWKGRAGGELFNGSGKTDILIREIDRNVFIAECKIWDGPKAVAEAIDQLMNYLVWRDSKAALIFFIRTKEPAATITKLHLAVGGHPRHMMTKPGSDPTKQVDYIFTADDEGRRVSLAVIPVVQTGKY